MEMMIKEWNDLIKIKKKEWQVEFSIIEVEVELIQYNLASKYNGEIIERDWKKYLKKYNIKKSNYMELKTYEGRDINTTTIYKGQIIKPPFIYDGRGFLQKIKDNKVTIYIGEFKNGSKCGKGTFYSGVNGEIIFKKEGQWKNDHLQSGSYINKDSIYKGTFKNSNKDGFGIYIDATEKYVGYFKDDEKLGKYIQLLDKNQIYKGFQKKHPWRPILKGTMTQFYEDGSTYSRNLSTYIGVKTWPNGYKYEGSIISNVTGIYTFGRISLREIYFIALMNSEELSEYLRHNYKDKILVDFMAGLSGLDVYRSNSSEIINDLLLNHNIDKMDNDIKYAYKILPNLIDKAKKRN